MVRLITNFVRFCIRQLWNAVIFATPWILRFLVYVSGVSIRLSIIASMTVFRGVDNVAQTIALDWKKRAVEGGFPYLWEVQLYQAYYVLAICTIFAGWLVILATVLLAVFFTVKSIF